MVSETWLNKKTKAELVEYLRKEDARFVAELVKMQEEIEDLTAALRKTGGDQLMDLTRANDSLQEDVKAAETRAEEAEARLKRIGANLRHDPHCNAHGDEDLAARGLLTCTCGALIW